MGNGRKTAIRCNTLTLGGAGNRTLVAAERHGKRQDGTSRMRRIRDVEPLVYRTLDLRDAYDAHVSGARRNAALKRPVMHFLMQFPVPGDGRAPAPSSQQVILQLAVEFVNETHGGDAVFAGRLDRDEQGGWAVDVWATPKYKKRTKRTPPDQKGEIWISTTKHGKDLCRRHRAEIERRHDGRFSTGPRQCGIALQSEWRQFLERRLPRIKLAPKQEKSAGLSDRLEPEAHKAVQDALKRASELEVEVNLGEERLAGIKRERVAEERTRDKATTVAAEIEAAAKRHLATLGTTLEAFGHMRHLSLVLGVVFDEPATIDLAVGSGADVNRRAPESHGMSPLHFAASLGAANAFRRLLFHGASHTLTDEHRRQAVDYAKNGPEGDPIRALHDEAVALRRAETETLRAESDDDDRTPEGP